MTAYRDIVKNPQVEDDEYCANGQHMNVLRDDGSIYCYNCKKEIKKKEMKVCPKCHCLISKLGFCVVCKGRTIVNSGGWYYLSEERKK